jgi:hypothetical protein
MEKVIVEIKPMIIVDEDGRHTIFDPKNKGGAIVSDVDPFVAMEKFKEATYLAFAVWNLLNFNAKLWRLPNFI